MASPLACIGIRMENQRALERAVLKLARTGRTLRLQSGCSLVRWQDSSGAGLSIYFEDRTVLCLIPFFEGGTRISALPTRWIANPGCPYCGALMVEVLDEYGEMAYPLAIELENAEAVRSSLRLQSTTQFQVTGFAEELEAWASRQEFDRSQASYRVQLGPHFFIPTGTFGEVDGFQPTAHASIGGTVITASSLVNSATGAGFVHLVVRSYGADYDVVIEPGTLPRAIEPGWIVRAQCWVVGSALVVN